MLRLKQLRTKRGMSQSELGKIIGVSPSTIGMYEQERRLPEVPTLKKIASFFNVSVDYLLGNDIIMPTNDLNQFLLQSRIVFDGEVIDVSDTDRELLHHMLQIAFQAIKYQKECIHDGGKGSL